MQRGYRGMMFVSILIINEGTCLEKVNGGIQELWIRLHLIEFGSSLRWLES